MTRELRKKLTLYLNIATLILFIINLTGSVSIEK